MTSSIFSLGNAIRAVLLVGLFGVVFVLVQSCQRPATGIDIYAKDTLKKLTMRENQPLPPTTIFQTADGEAEWDSPEALSLVDYLLSK